ncbi:MAG: CaiB/BaiF CoA transferase family protein [Pseudomonadota bacterium]
MPVAGPLSGILILDLTRVLAGPYCTMILADLGARVIKVETPGVGDDSRGYGPFFGNRSGYFAAMNRGKESIALDLKAESDRAILDRLLARADVLAENFRPGTMERLGLGWDALHARFPRLIYAATSGFGHSGPYAGRPAYDMVAQAMGGIMSVTGHPGGPPTRVGSSIGDLAAGLFTVVGIEAALLHRARSGEGMKLDIAMLDSQIAILENAVTRYCVTGRSPGPHGARHPSIAPFAAFATADRPIVVAAGTDALFVKLAEVMGRPDWPQDPRFATNAARADHVEALQAEMEAVLTRATAQHWLALFERAGIPSGPINDMAALFADPHVTARHMLVDVEDPDYRGLKVAGNPIKMSAFADPAKRGAVPKLDGDRARILADLEAGRL